MTDKSNSEMLQFVVLLVLGGVVGACIGYGNSGTIQNAVGGFGIGVASAWFLLSAG
jgi:hypothetical protein